MSKDLIAKMRDKYKSLDRNPNKPNISTMTDTKQSRFRESVKTVCSSFEKSSCSQPCFGLGLLFIVIDDLPHELIWRKWLELASEKSRSKVQIWIHAKYPDRVSSDWTRSHLVDYSFCPNWGSVEITKAMVEIVRTVTYQAIIILSS